MAAPAADDRRVALAAVAGAHGIKGEVRLKLFSDSVESLSRHKKIYVGGTERALLFVREGNRMVPTERALALCEPVRQALRQMEDALATVARFDPASATHTFRISGSDYFSILLMPRLAAAVLADAPGVTLQMLDHPSAEAVRLLGERLVTTKTTMRSIGDSVRTFEKGVMGVMEATVRT